MHLDAAPAAPGLNAPKDHLQGRPDPLLTDDLERGEEIVLVGFVTGATFRRKAILLTYAGEDGIQLRHLFIDDGICLFY
jgi:hypothetical protein